MYRRQELADKLGISLHTLHKYTKEGYIPKAKTALDGRYYVSAYTEGQFETARKRLNKAGLYRAVPKGCMTIKMLSEAYDISVPTMATRRSRKAFIEPKGRNLRGEYFSIKEFEKWLEEYKTPKPTVKELLLKDREVIKKRIRNGEPRSLIAKEYNCSQVTLAKYIRMSNKKVKSKHRLVNPWETANQAFNKVLHEIN